LTGPRRVAKPAPARSPSVDRATTPRHRHQQRRGCAGSQAANNAGGLSGLGPTNSPVTFCGGTLQLYGFELNTGVNYNTLYNPLVVPAGQTGTLACSRADRATAAPIPASPAALPAAARSTSL